MPKIVLKNGDTGGLEEFEPIDAREILAVEGTIYSVPEESQDETGLNIGPDGADINVPQLQGSDAEMQTGLSTDKYGRAAVVKAQPGNPTHTKRTAGTPAETPAVPTVGKGPRGKFYVKNGKELVDGPFETEDEANAALLKPAQPAA